MTSPHDHHRRERARRDRDTIHQAAAALRKQWSRARTSATPLPNLVLHVAPLLDRIEWALGGAALPGRVQQDAVELAQAILRETTPGADPKAQQPWSY